MPVPNATITISSEHRATFWETCAGQTRAIKRAFFLQCVLNVGTRLGQGIIWAALACSPAARMEGSGRGRGLSPSFRFLECENIFGGLL